MSSIKEKVEALKLMIDHLNRQINEFIQHDLLENIDDLLTQRYHFITDLVSELQSGNLEREHALSCLESLRQDNRQLELALGKRRDEIRRNVNNCKNVKQYLDV